MGISDRHVEVLCSSWISTFLLHSSNSSYSFPWQAVCRASLLSMATSHPLSENVPMLCHSTANHLSVLNQVGIESIDSFASVTNAQPSGVWSSSQSFNPRILLRIPQTRFRLSGFSWMPPSIRLIPRRFWLRNLREAHLVWCRTEVFVRHTFMD